jgi:hypothetical protein
MFNLISSSPMLTNVTFSANSAVQFGGGIYNWSSNPQIRNTIFWGNIAPIEAQIYNNSSTPAVSDSVVQGGYAGGTHIISADPVLGVLGKYGGSTQTLPLLAGSSAIDAGDDSVCPASDQRGMPRPQGGQCDIGAFEYHDPIFMVKPAAIGKGDCGSWADACTLQSALTYSAGGNGDQIWVAGGIYKPTPGGDRNATFQLKSGVALYGGFDGVEDAALSDRDPAAHVSRLSGDLNGDDVGFTNNAENVYNVVTGADGASLDGFTISGGNANGNGCPGGCGGGMYNYASSPTVTNLIFSGNYATYGGGMFNSGSSATVTNVTFNGNSAYQGGGVFNHSSSPILTNITISGNSAGFTGGGMFNHSSSPILTNITISGNTAVANGGGMYNFDFCHPEIRNTIIWGNTPNLQIINDTVCSPTVSDSVVQGGYAGGTHIISADPMLGPLGNYGGFTQTLPLLQGSSAIDTGNDSVCPAADQRGISRKQGAHCDIGAFEYSTRQLFMPLIWR